MSEVVVHFAAETHVDRSIADADITASRFGAQGVTTAGRWLVFVPGREERAAREVLDEPAAEAPEDNPVLRLVVIVGLITALLLATPFVAQACYGSR